MKSLRSSSALRHRFVHRRRHLALAALALILVVPMALAVDGNEISDFEETVFRAVNELPDLLYWPLWPFMQFGNLLVVPVLAVVTLVLGRLRLTGAILAVGALKLLVEDAVKAWVVRERPASVVADVIRRGDTASAGQAFVSGHAIIVVGLATVLHPYLSRRLRIVVWTLAFLVCFGRMYAGAHFPLDVIGGSLIGFALGSVLNFALGLPARTRNG